MKSLNKISFLLLIFILITSGLSAESKRIAVFNPSAEGLSSDEKNWLPSSVRRKFEANFNDYTDFQLIEVQNENEIKNLHKKAEGSAYDQSTSIALGKLVAAEYALFSSITKVGGKYILSANVTNLTTGLRLSSVSIDGVSEYINLFEGAGSSVNNATVKICSDLGIILSAVDKYILLKGNKLSDDDEIKMTKQELESYNKRKADLERQIKEISLSSQIDADLKKAKLESERILLEQQEKIAKDKIERLEKARVQLEQDQIEQQRRSDEQRKRISEVAAETEKKATELRNKKIESLAVDAQIAVIEAKKQALLEIRNNIKKQGDVIISMAQEEYTAECNKIDAVPLRKGELDSNGKILPDVKKRRENKKKKLKVEIEARAKKDIEALKKTVEEQETALLKAIAADREVLKTRRTISSLLDERISFIGNYAGEKYEWDATASLYISDVCIFSKKVPVPYQTLTKKVPVKASDFDNMNYDDYLDTVDLYDYMFRRKVPVISLEMDYYVEALDDNRPSEYRIVVTEARYVDTKYNKTLMICDLGQKNFYFVVNPTVDIRTEAEKSVKIDNSGNSNKTKSDSSNKSNGKQSGSKTKSNEPNAKLVKNDSDSRFLLSIITGFPNASDINKGILGTGFESYFLGTMPLSPSFFTQFDCGFIMEPTLNSAETFAFNYNLGFGFNKRLYWGSYKPNLYFSGAIGIFNVIDSEADKENFITYKITGGIDFPIFNLFCISLEYLGRYVDSYGWTNSLMLGTGIICK
ncbi:MAG: hypothetical protein K5829_01405 [Treponema sp.]|nr:hypothetical protein [Treponema sp.]